MNATKLESVLTPFMARASILAREIQNALPCELKIGTRQVTCPACQGTGNRPGREEYSCPLGVDYIGECLNAKVVVYQDLCPPCGARWHAEQAGSVLARIISRAKHVERERRRDLDLAKVETLRCQEALNKAQKNVEQARSRLDNKVG